MVRAVVGGWVWGVCGWGFVGGLSLRLPHPSLILFTAVAPTGTMATFLRFTTLGSSSS